MKDERKLNPGHEGIRAVLRFVGPCLMAGGALLGVIGLVSFFSSFGSFEPPRYFWCAFIGLPMFAVGLAITKVGFLGAVMRYQAREVAPVGKDTFNYLANGTQEGVETLATAMSRGLHAGSAPHTRSEVRCGQCDRSNAADAKFCAECGAPLRTSKECPACQDLNDPDARFCDNCGQAFGEK